MGLRPVSQIARNASSKALDTNQETWSELIVRIDNHMITTNNRKILIRCETNIFNLYRGAAEAELRVNEDSFWLNGGKVSPTTDQRSSTSKGDPDNSALQGGGHRLFGSESYAISFLLTLFYCTVARLS